MIKVCSVIQETQAWRLELEMSETPHGIRTEFVSYSPDADKNLVESDRRQLLLSREEVERLGSSMLSFVGKW
jgi:hypothetical protein